jgi:hypothetical protein
MNMSWLRWQQDARAAFIPIILRSSSSDPETTIGRRTYNPGITGDWRELRSGLRHYLDLAALAVFIRSS